MAQSKSEIVVSYHDATLTRADLALLAPGQWLNDAVIGCALEYFTHGHPLLSRSADQLAFVPPATVQLARAVPPAELPLLLEALQLPSKSLVFLPLNDATELETANAGSHWSLLLFRRLQTAPAHARGGEGGEGGSPAEASAGQFEYYDSYHAGVPDHAKQLAQALVPLLQPGAKLAATVTAQSCPRQGNSSDCGVHVVANIEKLAQAHVENREAQLLTAEKSRDYRQQLKETLAQLPRE